MKNLNFRFMTIASLIVISGSVFSSCYKDPKLDQHFDLDVILRGDKKSIGYVKFRQNPDKERIITLGVKVNHLLPNHEYLLQRAVDDFDKICTSTTWLTLGKGLTPQSILTDANGNGEQDLWRDISAIAAGTTFDIHFQIIDAVTLQAVLSSDCYYYKAR